MESLSITTPNATLPVSLADAKEHLRILHSQDDDYITSLIWTAASWLEQETDSTILTTEYRLKLGQWDDPIKLRKGPIQSVDSIYYYNTDNTKTEYTTYFLHNERVYLQNIPSLYDRPDAIEINYTAGETSTSYLAKQAILWQVATMYENRESEVVGKTTSKLKLGFERIVQLLRKGDYR